MGSSSSGLPGVLNGFSQDNQTLQNMQSYMENQSKNELNQEMVRSAAYFGFSERPEPVDPPPDPIPGPNNPISDWINSHSGNPNNNNNGKPNP